MNRVETAIHEGRCVLALGSRALRDPEVLAELRYRSSLNAVALAGDPVDPAVGISREALGPALAQAGGLIVLVEPESAVDAGGLTAISQLVQSAPNKPRLTIAARAFNPFTLPPPLRMLKMEQERKRAKDFLASLPVSLPPAESAAPVAPAAPSVVAVPATAVPEPEAPRKDRAPRVGFSGREEEVAAFSEMLGQGGPIALVGPAGVGRRWLVEQVLKDTPLRRVPDLELGWGTEADALYARLAALAAEAGDERLAQAVRAPEERPAPLELAGLAVECLGAEGLSNVIMVIHGVDRLMRDDGTFHRRGRQELLLEALFAGSYGPRLVFPLERKPVFYREGAAASLRVLPLGGLKGRELYEIFDAYRYAEVPRDKMGEVHNQVHGHPLATRLFAVAARDADAPEKLLDDRKFLKMGDVADLEPLDRLLKRRVERLAPDLRAALATTAHARYPLDAEALQALGVSRADRLALMAQGLLDFTPNEADRRFYVHPLVAKHLARREITDIQILEKLAEVCLEVGRKARGLERLAWGQEANRCLVGSRNPQHTVRVGFPDHDPILESCRGLIRSQRPHFPLAEMRLNQILKADPGNTEAWLLRAELIQAGKGSREAVEECYRKAAELAPTPEVFHHEATFHQQRGRRGDSEAAITALQNGAARYPMNGRLRRRLAGLLIQVGRTDQALAVLRETMDLEPMMPDTYGLLGQVLVDMGPAHWDEAAQHLEEALRLAPEDPVHLARIGRLDRLRGLLEPEQRAACFARAQERLEGAIKAERRQGEALVELATLLLDRQEETDMDRVGWLLKQASQQKNPPDLQVLKARAAARAGRTGEAEAALDALVKRDPKNYLARAAYGEVLYARRRIFAAHAQYQQAQQDAPPHAPERHAWEGILAQLRQLIESGQAIELERLADEEASSAPTVVAEVPASRVRARRRRGKEPAPEADAAQPGTPEPAGEPGGEPGGEPAPEPAVDIEPEAAPEPAVDAGPEPEAAPSDEER